jgi:hypothetical protein
MIETQPDSSRTLSLEDVQWPMGSSHRANIAASGAQLPQPLAVGKLNPEPTKNEILYGFSLHPSLRTVRPFCVTFEQSQGGIAALVHDLNEYGFGATRPEALEDLRHTLAELYFTLEAESGRLSADLASLWMHFSSHVNRIRA